MSTPNIPQPIPFKLARTRTDLFGALVRAKREFGGSKTILIDGDDRELTYNELLQGSLAIGSALKKGTARNDTIGLMLPTSIGAVVTFYALSAYGRIPAMLNFTAGARNLKSAMNTAQIKRVLTSRKFVELGELEDLIAQLSETAEIIYLEDVKENLSLLNKLQGVVGATVPSLVRKRAESVSPGVVLFTSGTEGEPKGVVLSHQNIIANAEQVRAHIGLSAKTDTLINPLPTFHCFGLTVGSVLPIMAGITAIFHPTPLQPREIVKRIAKHRPTIMLATDTFIAQYARIAKGDQLSSIRLAVCGAERVKDETRALVRKKFDIEILEGYGATEAAPVVAANQWENNKPGTVGFLMSGMEHKLEDVEGIEDGGRLHIRGPNVMIGYLRSSSPGVIERLPEGWHDTGDVVSFDSEGFIRIQGRLKRFAKIGGEMVSLAVVENCASAMWPDNLHAAVAIPDPRKGEQIILLSDAPNCDRADILAWARNHGVPELAVPRKVFHVDEIPVMGTGKIDYGAIKQTVEALTES